jgi:preprotein translocase subunit SecF
MEFFKSNLNIAFLGKRHAMVAAVLSAALVTTSLVSFFTRGFNLGIDFTGGLLLEVAYEQPADLGDVRSALTTGGFPGAMVQHFGTDKDVLIRLPPQGKGSSAEVSTKALSALEGKAKGAVQIRRVEFVGPQVGDELTEQGGLAALYTLIGILIYLAVRFEYRLAVGAVIATIHDVVITVGVFSLFHIEFDLSVLAAVLAVMGYSVNDTVVVFDRIRENFRKMRKGTPVEIVNAAMNQTLSRTIMTSATTSLVVVALLIFGGEIIHGFALALIIGILVGTYSSIYVASAAALALGVSREDLMPVKKEGAEADSAP